MYNYGYALSPFAPGYPASARKAPYEERPLAACSVRNAGRAERADAGRIRIPSPHLPGFRSAVLRKELLPLPQRETAIGQHESGSLRHTRCSREVP